MSIVQEKFRRQMMVTGLKVPRQVAPLTSRRSRAAGTCVCRNGGWFDLKGICINCGGVKPPPA